MHRARSIVTTLLGVLTFGLVFAGAPAGHAATLVPISGAGSTWSSNAIDQWRRNVNQFGLRVNYQATGSSDGRNQFRNGTVDYGVSEIPYGQTDNSVIDPPPGNRPFAYMPIVAGGTAFMYNLKIGGKRVTNLRLSGDTLTKIFTKGIKSWDDPAIKADNPGLSLPARTIVPVVRSDGSGTTAQFTLWMAHQYQSMWDGYCNNVRKSPCGQTSSYPRSDNMLALAGSLGVAGYVSQDKNEGTITYVEYSYALNTHFPVVKLLNKAGYYVEPTAPNVAVALQSAQINADLTQKLDGVYNNPDKRTYPMSSYSYMIVPTSTAPPMNNDKGYTLSRFANYFLCQGQQAAPNLGYSPLPRNLVQAGLDVVKKIPGYDTTGVDINKCANPTFGPGGTNLLAKSAPNPPECDKKGGPVSCATGTGGAKTPTNTNGGTGGTNNGGTNGGAVTPTPAPGQTPVPGSATPVPGVDPSTQVPGGQVPGSTTDPDTGQPVTTNTNGQAVASTGNLTGGTGNGFSTVLVFFAGMVFAAVIIGPPLAARRLNPPNRGGDGTP